MYIACFYWELLFIFCFFFFFAIIHSKHDQNQPFPFCSLNYSRHFRDLGQNCKTVLKTDITRSERNLSLYKDLVSVHKPKEKYTIWCSKTQKSPSVATELNSNFHTLSTLNIGEISWSTDSSCWVHKFSWHGGKRPLHSEASPPFPFSSEWIMFLNPSMPLERRFPFCDFAKNRLCKHFNPCAFFGVSWRDDCIKGRGDFHLAIPWSFPARVTSARLHSTVQYLVQRSENSEK